MLAEVERAEAERIAVEAEVERARIAAEAEAERVVLAERRAVAETVVKARKTAGAKARAEDTETAIAAFLTTHAGDRGGKGPTLREVAEAVGIKPRSVQRYAAWTNRNTTSDPEPVAGPASDRSEATGRAELNGSNSSDGEQTVLEAV